MAGLTKKTSAFDDENLSGRSQKLFYEVTEEENFTYYGNHEVDFNKRTSIDCEGITPHDLNQKIKFSKLIIDDSQRIVMRPYNNQIWDYKNRITKHLGKEIIDTNIKFLDSLKKTKLHISGYLSTTFSQSISYNIPTLGLIVEDLYSFSSKFNIHRTRQNFPNNGIDSFDYMAAEGVKVIDRVVEKELKGKINLVKNTWVIPFK